MPDKSWKAFERRIAKAFGGTRRGADFRDARGGKNDVIHDVYSIECKLLGRPSFSQLLLACIQAEKAADPLQEPVAVVKRLRDRDNDALVCMRLKTFLEWHI